MKARLEYWIVLVFSRLVCALPLDCALTWGRALGVIMGRVVRYRRQVALDNLHRAFGTEKTEEECRKILDGVYRHLGQMLVEFCRFPVLSGLQIERLVTIEHPEILEEAAKHLRGVVIVSGHFGNWEMMGAALAQHEISVGALVANQKNTAVGDLMDRFRRGVHVNPIRVGISVKEILRALEGGEFVAIVADQNAGKRGVFVEFFGHPTSTPQGPAAIFLRRNAPIVLAFALREPEGRHRVILERFPNPDHFPLGAEGLRQVTQLYTQRLEFHIRRHPEQWLWLHRRWKCSPG
ncbi:MAG: lysophospholipid acyltransferase family protein [Candidatus Latescibacterota bacterium]